MRKYKYIPRTMRLHYLSRVPNRCPVRWVYSGHFEICLAADNRLVHPMWPWVDSTGIPDQILRSQARGGQGQEEQKQRGTGLLIRSDNSGLERLLGIHGRAKETWSMRVYVCARVHMCAHVRLHKMMCTARVPIHLPCTRTLPNIHGFNMFCSMCYYHVLRCK